MITEYLNFLSEIVLKYGYIILFFGIMLENIFIVGLFFPGLFILVMCGYLSGNGDLNLFWCLLVGYSGTIIGDNLSYLLGRKGLVNVNMIKRFTSKYSSIEKKLGSEKQVLIFLLFYQFPVYSRMIVPTMLGAIKYDYKKWFRINLIGAFIFSTTFILLGFVIGKSSKLLDEAIEISEIIQWVFFGLFLYFIISFIFKIRKLLKK